MSEHLYTYDDPPSERDLIKACSVLESGGVIAYPLDKTWAFACDASQIKALDKIRRLKPSHPKDQPFSLVCSSISMASKLGSIDHQLFRHLKKAWPGPYTILVKRNKSLPKQIKDKRQVVGLRIPQSPLVLALIEKYGKALASTGLPRQEDGEFFRFGYQIFERYSNSIDLLLDLGDELPCLESTIIDFSEDEPVLKRLGEGDPSIFGGSIIES